MERLIWDAPNILVFTITLIILQLSLAELCFILPIMGLKFSFLREISIGVQPGGSVMILTKKQRKKARKNRKKNWKKVKRYFRIRYRIDHLQDWSIWYDVTLDPIFGVSNYDTPFFLKRSVEIRVLEKNKIPRFDRIFASYSRKESWVILVMCRNFADDLSAEAYFILDV